jgi:glycosyltransferase involved in cell wall biosynthesis
MAHLNLMVLLLRPLLPTMIRVCVRQNGDLSATLAAFKISWLARRLYAIAYRRAHRVICQTPPMAAELLSQLGLEPQKLIVLLNPIDIDEIRAASSPAITVHPSPNPRLVAIARLAHEKGLDLLLEAFAGLLRNHSNAELEILGTGPCRHALQAQCQALGIEDHVHFRGEVSHPARYFQSVTAFVLSSRHEGLPNALLEAAAAGIPIVALPASAGLVRLVSSQPGVWLAKTISASALENALINALASIQPGQRFSHTWVEPFHLKRALPAFEYMMEEVLNERVS